MNPAESGKAIVNFKASDPVCKVHGTLAGYQSMSRKYPAKMGHAVFRKDQPVVIVTELLKSQKEEQEKAVLRKFQWTLQRDHTVQFDVIAWPGDLEESHHDFKCRLDIVDVYGQFAEMILPRHAISRDLYGKIENTVRADLETSSKQLAGLCLHVTLEFTSEQQQRICRGSLRELCPAIAEALREFASEMREAGIGVPQMRRLPKPVGRNGGQITIWGWRSALADLPALFELRVTDNLSYGDGELESAFIHLVSKKILKSYADESILVCYAIYAPPFVQDNEVFREAYRLLDNNGHRFKEAWYFYPIAGDRGGCAYRFWSRK